MVQYETIMYLWIVFELYCAEKYHVDGLKQMTNTRQKRNGVMLCFAGCPPGEIQRKLVLDEPKVLSTFSSEPNCPKMAET